METVVITEMIHSVGFPIAVCIALFYQNFKIQETHNKTFTEFKNVINHNTTSIIQLTALVKEIQKGENNDV